MLQESDLQIMLKTFKFDNQYLAHHLKAKHKFRLKFDNFEVSKLENAIQIKLSMLKNFYSIKIKLI